MCRPVWNCSWAPWLLSVVHIERITARSSMHEPRCGHQSLTSMPGLAALAKADLKRIERLANVAVGVVRHDDPHIAGELALERIGERRLGDRLAGVSIQGGLGIEALEMAGAADHEQPDDVLGLGREMGPPVGRLPCRRATVIGLRESVAMEHRAQGQAGKAHAHVGQECPSRRHYGCVVIGS